MIFCVLQAMNMREFQTKEHAYVKWSYVPFQFCTRPIWKKSESNGDFNLLQKLPSTTADTLTEVFLYPDWGFSLPWLRFFYPDWGFSLPWLRFFSILTGVFLPWLRFFHPDWGFSLPWLRFFITWLRFFLPWQVFLYPDWGFSLPWLRFFSTLTGFSLPWLRFFSTLTEVFPCFFLSCKANARV